MMDGMVDRGIDRYAVSNVDELFGGTCQLTDPGCVYMSQTLSMRSLWISSLEISPHLNTPFCLSILLFFALTFYTLDTLDVSSFLFRRLSSRLIQLFITISNVDSPSISILSIPPCSESLTLELHLSHQPRPTQTQTPILTIPHPHLLSPRLKRHPFTTTPREMKSWIGLDLRYK
jgi:hypothetical protein